MVEEGQLDGDKEDRIEEDQEDDLVPNHEESVGWVKEVPFLGLALVDYLDVAADPLYHAGFLPISDALVTEEFYLREESEGFLLFDLSLDDQEEVQQASQLCPLGAFLGNVLAVLGPFDLAF